MSEISEKTRMLEDARTELIRKERRSIPGDEKESVNAEKKALTAKIRGLRHELKLCGQIEERSGTVRANLEIIDSDRQRERNMER